MLFSIILKYFIFKNFLDWNETRQSGGTTTIDDPVLRLLPRKDMSIYICAIQFLATVMFIMQTGWRSVRMLSIFTDICMVKTLTLLVCPLRPPTDIIPLRDVFLEVFVQNSNGSSHVRDLFFSGHISYLTLLAFLSPPSSTVIYVAFIIPMSLFLMMNRVHYFIDILMAPFVVYVCINVRR
jgi:hypothetical protein